MGHTQSRKAKLPAALLRKASVLAPADPRTIRKVLRGEPVSPMAAERVMRALRRMGLSHLVPEAEQ